MTATYRADLSWVDDPAIEQARVEERAELRARNAFAELVARSPYANLAEFEEVLEETLFAQGIDLGDTRARDDVAKLADHLAHMATAAAKRREVHVPLRQDTNCTDYGAQEAPGGRLDMSDGKIWPKPGHAPRVHGVTYLGDAYADCPCGWAIEGEARAVEKWAYAHERAAAEGGWGLIGLST